MPLHLVDATYELFRAHFAPRPPVLGRDGIPLSGVSGLCDQLLYLLREEGATHVGCATDRVIESFRNDLFAGYKSSAGTGSSCPGSPVCATSCSTSCEKRARRTSAAPPTA